MITQEICERSVVIITDKTLQEKAIMIADKLSEWGHLIKAEWNVMKPDASVEMLRELLTGKDRAIVFVKRSHEKAIRQISTTARKKGYQPFVADKEWAEVVPYIENDFQIVPMSIDKRTNNGPFTIIGDIHGCADELMALLQETGHANEGWATDAEENWVNYLKPHNEGRKVIFLGDLVDRGQKNLMTMIICRKAEDFGALRVLGNHDYKIGRWLKGGNVSVGPHQQPTMVEFANMTPEERTEWGDWLLNTEAHYILDGGKLVVAHAGMDEDNLGRTTSGAHAMALYGKPVLTGELDADGYPLAEDWALDYHGEATVVHGHVVYDNPRITNDKVIAIDTGCVFGGTLTALQWPEKTFAAVQAVKEWWKRRPGD